MEAYTNSVREGGAYYGVSALMIVARIRYEQRLYQAALDAAIEYLKAVPQAPLISDYVLVAHLRSLGAQVR